MEEVSPAVAMPFMSFPDTQMELAGIMLGKGYHNGQYSTQDSDNNGDSRQETSRSVSESRRVLSSRINSPNFNMKNHSSSADISAAGEEINGSDERSTEKKMISRTESRTLFEFKSVPLYGVTSICGRRPEMEDALSAIPRFLQSPTNSLIDGRFNPQSAAHFFGVYDGHGGSQVTNQSPLYIAKVYDFESLIEILCCVGSELLQREDAFGFSGGDREGETDAL